MSRILRKSLCIASVALNVLRRVSIGEFVCRISSRDFVGLADTMIRPPNHHGLVFLFWAYDFPMMFASCILSQLSFTQVFHVPVLFFAAKLPGHFFMFARHLLELVLSCSTCNSSSHV